MEKIKYDIVRGKKAGIKGLEAEQCFHCGIVGKGQMTRKWKEEGGSQAVLEVNDPCDDGGKKINLQIIGSVLLQSKLEVAFLFVCFLLLLSVLFFKQVEGQKFSKT